MRERRWPALAGAVLATYLGALAVSWGFADLSAAMPRVVMDQWREGARAFDEPLWQRARVHLEVAMAFHGLDPDYPAELGRLYSWRALATPPWREDAGALRAEAIAHYRSALRRRPSWGFVWAQLAEARLLNGDQDDQTLHALDLAVALAPWEPEAQQLIITLGLAQWGRLTPMRRKALEAIISHAVVLDNDIQGVLSSARRFGREDVVKPLLERRGGAPRTP